MRAATALVHVLDAAPLGRQQEQGRAVLAAQHGGEDRAVVLDPVQQLAALANPDDRPLGGIVPAGVRACVGRLDPDGTLGVQADAVRAKTLGPGSAVREGVPSVAMSNAVRRPANDSEMISVELSGVITMPLGNSRSPATLRAAPSGVTSTMIPGVGGSPARNPKPMPLR